MNAIERIEAAHQHMAEAIPLILDLQARLAAAQADVAALTAERDKAQAEALMLRGVIADKDVLIEQLRTRIAELEQPQPPTPPPPPVDVWWEVVATAGVKVRKGAGTGYADYGKAAAIAQGKRVQELERQNVGDDIWIRHGEARWSAARYGGADLMRQVQTVPAEPVEPPAIPAPPPVVGKYSEWEGLPPHHELWFGWDGPADTGDWGGASHGWPWGPAPGNDPYGVQGIVTASGVRTMNLHYPGTPRWVADWLRSRRFPPSVPEKADAPQILGLTGRIRPRDLHHTAYTAESLLEEVTPFVNEAIAQGVEILAALNECDWPTEGAGVSYAGPIELSTLLLKFQALAGARWPRVQWLMPAMTYSPQGRDWFEALVRMGAHEAFHGIALHGYADTIDGMIAVANDHLAIARRFPHHFIVVNELGLTTNVAGVSEQGKAQLAAAYINHVAPRTDNIKVVSWFTSYTTKPEHKHMAASAEMARTIAQLKPVWA